MLWSKGGALCLCLLLTFGCSKKHDDKVNILVPIPLTGAAASYGKVIKEGVEIGLEELGNDPVRNEINVIYRDSKLSISEIVKIFQQETALHKISVIMPASTGESLALAPLCNKGRIVLLPPLADGDDLTKGSDYVFMVSPASSYQGKALADVVSTDGHQQVAVIYLQDAWGTGLNNTFCKDFNSDGRTAEISAGIQPGQMDFRAILSRIKQSDVDALVMFIHPAETGSLLKQIREMDIGVSLYGGDTFSNKTIYKEFSDLAQGVIFVLPTLSQSQQFLDFSARYKSRYGTKADVNAASSRDAVLLVSKAVAAGHFSGSSIAAFFRDELRFFNGASGNIAWDSKGNVISKEYSVFVIVGSRYEQRTKN